MSKVFGLGGLVIGALLAASGVVSLSEQWSSRAPKPITWTQFAAQKPTSGNFRISGGTLNIAEGIWIEDIVTNEVGNIYIPMRAASGAQQDAARKQPAFLLVRVDDSQIAAMIKQVQKLDAIKTPDAARKSLQWQANNRNRLLVSRPIEGVLAEGFEALDDHEKNLIEESGAKLEPNFVILQENVRPQYGASLFTMLAGAGLVVWGVLRLRGRAQNI